MKKIEDFGNLIITASVKFEAQSIIINNLSPKKKKKKIKINKIPLSNPYLAQMPQSKPNKYVNINNIYCKFFIIKIQRKQLKKKSPGDNSSCTVVTKMAE